jgi:tetratricopeptide (TPR) repeat protein
MPGELSVNPPPPPPVPPDNPVAQAMVQALALMAAGQFGVAAELFRRVAGSVDEPGNFVREYCLANANFSDGLNFARNGDRPKAVDCLTQAINRFEGELLPGVEEIEDLEERNQQRIGLVLTFAGAKAAKYSAQMMEDIVKEDFDSALETASDIFADLDQTRSIVDNCESQISASGGQVDQMTLVRNSLSTERLGLSGLASFAEAERASTSKDWSKAQNAFKAAKQQLRKARDAYAASPLTASQAQVWQTAVEMLVEPAQRRCKNLQKMWEELERYKGGMIDIARAVGAANVTNVNSLSSAVEVNVTIVKEIEDHTRTALNDLKAAIEAAPADEEQKKRAFAAIDSLTSIPLHDSGFFGKLKKVAKDSADIVADIAKVAGPVATAWNVFAPFFGLPILPLPGK